MTTISSSNQHHITFFGQSNAGKSTIINKLTEQNLATGPYKLIETTSLIDLTETDHGQLTMDILNKTDMAIIVFDVDQDLHLSESEIIAQLKHKKIPCLGVLNKTDLLKASFSYTIKETIELFLEKYSEYFNIPFVPTSSIHNPESKALKEALIPLLSPLRNKSNSSQPSINPGDFILLVLEDDNKVSEDNELSNNNELSKQTQLSHLQEISQYILEHKGVVIVTNNNDLKETLANLGKTPRHIMTDFNSFLKA